MDMETKMLLERALEDWYRYGGSGNADTAIGILAELAGLEVSYNGDATVTIVRTKK